MFLLMFCSFCQTASARRNAASLIGDEDDVPPSPTVAGGGFFESNEAGGAPIIDATAPQEADVAAMAAEGVLDDDESDAPEDLSGFYVDDGAGPSS